MAERVFQDYFGLLIPLLTALLFIVYVKRNRVSMLKSVLFGHFSKVHFKSVSQTTNEKEMTILFWSAIFLQGIYVHSFFIENSTKIIFYYALVVSAIVIKHLAIKTSSNIFQKQQLFQEYYTSFLITLINIGWASAPFSATNILYYNYISIVSFERLNYGFLSIVFIYLFYRIGYLFFTALKEKISYLHIIFYICTLEILPIVIISYYFLNN